MQLCVDRRLKNRPRDLQVSEPAAFRGRRRRRVVLRGLLLRLQPRPNLGEAVDQFFVDVAVRRVQGVLGVRVVLYSTDHFRFGKGYYRPRIVVLC